MKYLMFSLILLLSTSAFAQRKSISQTEIEVGDRYAYTLRTNTLPQKKILAAFGEAMNTTLDMDFSGNWETTDEDGIEYRYNTRRNRLSISCEGGDEVTAARARAIVATFRERLGIDSDDDDDE